ncbi:unnamed protein product [Sphagnum tenellum]
MGIPAYPRVECGHGCTLWQRAGGHRVHINSGLWREFHAVLCQFFTSTIQSGSQYEPSNKAIFRMLKNLACLPSLATSIMKAHEVKKELQKSLLEAEVPDHVVVSWPQKELPSSNSIWDEFGPVFASAITNTWRCRSRMRSRSPSWGAKSAARHNRVYKKKEFGMAPIHTSRGTNKTNKKHRITCREKT